MAQPHTFAFLLFIAVECIVNGELAQRTPRVTCVPGKAQFPNPYDRYSFYKCDAAKNPILLQCPHGTWFNPRLEVCDWDTGNNGQQGGGGNEQSGGNSEGGYPHNQSPNFASTENWWKPPSTTTNTPTNEGNNNNNNNVGNGERPSSNGQCDPNSPFSYHVSEDCSTFFTCVQGRVVAIFCPPQTYYNPQRFRCERTVPRYCRLIGSNAPAGSEVQAPTNDDVWQYARFG